MKELLIIQAELKAPKSQYNSFGKYHYRKCEDIFEAVKPLLLKNGCVLTVTDEIKEIQSIIFVEAVAEITNEAGEVVSVKAQAGIDITRKGMDMAQCFGSSSSYARKYALNGLFLIDDVADADTKDNSEKAEKSPEKKEPETWLNAYKNKEKTEFTPEFETAHKAIHDGINGKKYSVEDIRKKYKISKEVAELLTNPETIL